MATITLSNTNTVIATVSVGWDPEGIGVNHLKNRIFVANTNNGYVSVIDGNTNTVIANVPVGDWPTGVGVNP